MDNLTTNELLALISGLCFVSALIGGFVAGLLMALTTGGTATKTTHNAPEASTPHKTVARKIRTQKSHTTYRPASTYVTPRPLTDTRLETTPSGHTIQPSNLINLRKNTRGGYSVNGE